MECKNCGYEYFEEQTIIKHVKASAGTSEPVRTDTHVPLAPYSRERFFRYKCAHCDEILTDVPVHYVSEVRTPDANHIIRISPLPLSIKIILWSVGNFVRNINLAKCRIIAVSNFIFIIKHSCVSTRCLCHMKLHIRLA